MVALDEDIASTEVKKPRLRDEDELNLFKTPKKLLSPMDSAKNNLVQNPPPTCHSFNRRRTSELLSSERRQSGAKVKKKLNFDKPTSFSLPLLHDHIFGVKPRNSHGAEADVHALIRVCASQSELFVEFAQKNYDLFNLNPLINAPHTRLLSFQYQHTSYT